MQMLEASRTVPRPRKALKPLKGLQQARVMVPTISADLVFITFTCLALEGRGVGSLSFQQVFFSPSLSLLSWLLWTANQALRRRRAQFGVAPHLCTNFRVSSTPNRRTASPRQRLTAKSTVYNLIGAPDNQSSRITDDCSSLSPTWHI